MKKVRILNAEEESLDTSDGVKWYALCIEHNWLQPFRRKKDAIEHSTDNQQAEWCEHCSLNYEWNEDTENFEEVKK